MSESVNSRVGYCLVPQMTISFHAIISSCSCAYDPIAMHSLISRGRECDILFTRIAEFITPLSLHRRIIKVTDELLATCR